MTIHIDYDREENKIESILASQTKMIRTLVNGTPCTKMHKKLLFTVISFSNKYKGSKKAKCSMTKCANFLTF